jgi:hypothetical protein
LEKTILRVDRQTVKRRDTASKKWSDTEPEDKSLVYVL